MRLSVDDEIARLTQVFTEANSNKLRSHQGGSCRSRSLLVAIGMLLAIYALLPRDFFGALLDLSAAYRTAKTFVKGNDQISVTPTKNSHARSSNITLRYFPVAGRGELARLYAVAGGLHITDSMQHGRSYKNDTRFGFLPVLDDPLNGLVGLQESLAVERYVAAMAPGFAGLTPQERALDDMFAQSKEDLLQVLGPKVYFGNRSSAPYVVPPLLDRYFGVWEKLLPEDGFLHGHAFPTGADLAGLIVCKSAFPFVQSMELANFDGWETRFPRVHALAERTAGAPAAASPQSSVSSEQWESSKGLL